jgi:hypothetical protein
MLLIGDRHEFHKIPTGFSDEARGFLKTYVVRKGNPCSDLGGLAGPWLM